MSLDVRLGLCGFTIGAGEYVRRYRVVEVQQTFYEPPADAVMARWRRSAPPGFEFTLKAWQLITHENASPTYRRMRSPLPEEPVGAFRLNSATVAAWSRTLECVSLVRATAVLLQCPASFRPTDENVARMRAFLSTVDRPVRVLWEPRGKWWPADLVRELCTELDLVHVVDPFVHATVTPEATYYRLHGTTGARHVYTDDELRRLRSMLPSEGVAYVMFNNIPRVVDAERFRSLLAP